jgi:hypothetical protein
MARVAILAIIPVMALLAWRDVVVERQLRTLAYDDAYRDEQARLQIAARDDVIDDAMWKLIDGDAERAVARIKEAARMPAPTGMPERAWLVAAAASCTRNDPAAQRDYSGWRSDVRVRRYCALNTPATFAVKK